ncbi:MAG: hypothetical protein ACI3Y4_07970 [Candidatus Cryptobacteroides sp.]
MDIQQLSTMVRDLVLQQDKVVVPGLGVFSAELVPASFSDRGYTLNPPYRKLSFEAENPSTASQQEDSRNIIKADAAQLQQCVADLRTELQSSKCVELPLLGKLRLTTSGELYFIADPDLDIYPDAFGLHPVSMKNHEPQISDADLSALDVDTPMIEPAQQPEAPQPEAPQPEDLKPAQQPVPRPDEEQPVAPAPQTPVTVSQATAEAPQTPISEENTMTEENTKKKHPALKVIGIVILVLMVAMIAFRLLALIAPDFIDSILYTEEELRLLGK